MVHKDINFEPLPDPPADPHIECIGIKVEGVSIIYIYIPPQSSCRPNYKPIITPLLPSGDAIVLGDFDAHNSLWYSSNQDTRGQLFAEEIGDSNFGVLNTDKDIISFMNP